MNYAFHAAELHRFGRQTETFDLLSRAAALKDIPEEEINSLREERKRIENG